MKAFIASVILVTTFAATTASACDYLQGRWQDSNGAVLNLNQIGCNIIGAYEEAYAGRGFNATYTQFITGYVSDFGPTRLSNQRTNPWGCTTVVQFDVQRQGNQMVAYMRGSDGACDVPANTNGTYYFNMQ
jgi:hypothetical protein